MDKTIGNLLHAIPDAEEYQDRLHHISESASRHLAEWMQAAGQQRLAYLALKADLDLLADEVGRADGVVRSWRDDIQEGANDLGLLIPTLGFRLIKSLPDEIA